MEYKTKEKLDELLKYLSSLGSAAIAFSGGVDSTFLLKAAKMALGNNILAIMVTAPYIPQWEIEEAKNLLNEFKVKHEFISVDINDKIKYSPVDRCYICKGFIFNKIIQRAKQHGIKNIIDGTNFDDTKDYRPGLKALKELNVVSPLLECEFTKEEIRQFSKELRLSTWNKPAYACLLSRIPYGQEVEEEELRRIEKAELYLMDLGFNGVRVRSHKDLARIEVQPEDMVKIFNVDIMNEISKKIKEIGYKFVTLDMEGYNVGSMNRGIER
jgi:uncharacterized protein